MSVGGEYDDGVVRVRLDGGSLAGRVVFLCLPFTLAPYLLFFLGGCGLFLPLVAASITDSIIPVLSGDEREVLMASIWMTICFVEHTTI